LSHSEDVSHKFLPRGFGLDLYTVTLLSTQIYFGQIIDFFKLCNQDYTYWVWYKVKVTVAEHGTSQNRHSVRKTLRRCNHLVTASGKLLRKRQENRLLIQLFTSV